MALATLDNVNAPEKYSFPPAAMWTTAAAPVYHTISPGTPGVDHRDVLYALLRAKNRLHKNGWVKGMALSDRGNICLGTALGMIPAGSYFDPSPGARAAAGRVEKLVGPVATWNDKVAGSLDHVQSVLDNVINATINDLARSA